MMRIRVGVIRVKYRKAYVGYMGCLLCAFLIWTILNVIGGDVYADMGSYGDGENTTGVSTGCEQRNHAFTGLCSCRNYGDCGEPGYGGGGASWRLFRINKDLKVDDPKNAYGLDNSKFKVNIIEGDLTKAEAIANCINPKVGARWIVSFGWDGRYDSPLGYPDFNYQIGPARRNEGAIRDALPNNYNVVTNLEDLRKNNFPNNTKISPQIALEMWRRLPGKNTSAAIPDSVGYFCFAGFGDEFGGKTTAYTADASGGKNVATKWTSSENEEVSTTITSCNVVSGCKVRFDHELKRIQGEGATTYKIVRTNNYKAKDERSEIIISGKTEKFASLTNGTPKKVRYGDKITVYPGQKVCEEMSFLADGESKWVSTKACVLVIGDAGSDKTMLNMEIKKGENDYTSVVYARPGEELTYRATYNPTLQRAASVVPDVIRINGGSKISNSSKKTLKNLFNDKNGSMPDWKNAFSVRGDYYNKKYSYRVGVEKRDPIRTFTVNRAKVGRELKETAETNAYTETSTVPNRVRFTLESGKLVGNIYTKGLSSEAKAIVPYNFKNSIEIDDVTTIYAGEQVNNVKYKITTDKKPNKKVGGDPYATIVRDAKWYTQICYKVSGREECERKDEGGNLHDNNSTEKSEKSGNTSLKIPDVPAGTNVQVKACVYPSTSGASDNWQDPEGDHQWSCSSKELVVAKRPSFQVWGGSMYSAGDVNVPIADKTFTVGRVFGSWVELGIVSSGKIQGLASGAGLGYANSNDALNAIKKSVGTISDLGGGTNSDYCLMSTLSFANEKCRDNRVGSLGGAPRAINGDALIEKLKELGAEYKELFDGEKLPDMTFVEDKTYLYYKKGGELIIDKNIEYKDGKYRSLEGIPKIVIYAKGDIEINCGVTRIDAVLVADGSINDCADSTNINSAGNSKQLVINGSVTAQTLTLNRTYGAAAGVNSIIPAEIINYDSSLYLWANGQSKITKTGKMRTALQKELSPRY